MDRHILLCVNDGRSENNVHHLQLHGRRSEIIQHKDRGITKQCTRPGLAKSSRQGLQQARLQNDYERLIGRVQTSLRYPTINQFADQFQQRFSQFQSIAAEIDLVYRALSVDPREACNQQVA